MKAYATLLAVLCVGTGLAQQAETPPATAPPAVRKVPNPEVLQVLVEREKAIRYSFRHAGTRKHPKEVFQPAKYELRLRQISASNCPEKFQVAWMDYQMAWHNHVKQTARRELVFFIEAASAVAGGLSPMTVIAGAKTLTRPVEDTYPAWVKVKEEAVLHHIHFPEKYADF
jgi:hypothetical protein